MKTIYLTIAIICVAFTFSCKEQKKEDVQNEIELTKAPTEKDTAPKTKSSETVLKTKSGKTITINEEKNSASLSNISIKTEGFEAANEEYQINESNPITAIFQADLDNNSFEEVYIITQSAGSGSYQNIIGYASNRDKSFTPIYLPEINDNDLKAGAVFEGFQGQDSVYVDNNQLLRKFPIFKEGDANCCPTGGEKTVEYELKQGEASWVLGVKK